MLVAGGAAAWAVGPFAAVPAAVAAAAVVGVVIGWRRFVAWPAGVAGAVSLAATVAALVYRPDYGRGAGMLGLAESAALMVLVAAVVRWAPRRQAVVAGLLAGAAVSVWILRAIPARTVWEVLVACGLWAVGPAAAAVVGGYPRLAEARRRRSVAAARRAQRLAVARDLHDFVAHDIGGIVVQAQAARYVAATDPGRALDALERIEAAGLRALAAMDRTVRMLNEHAADDALPGLPDLPVLATRFAEEGTTRVVLDVEEGLQVPRDVGTAAYRIVMEALTNVRRHAPGAGSVTVAVARQAGPALAVTVTDDGGMPSGPADRGGFGLIGLTERVQALGGSLTAGPHAGGWRLSAVLPWEEGP